MHISTVFSFVWIARPYGSLGLIPSSHKAAAAAAAVRTRRRRRRRRKTHTTNKRQVVYNTAAAACGQPRDSRREHNTFLFFFFFFFLILPRLSAASIRLFAHVMASSSSMAAFSFSFQPQRPHFTGGASPRRLICINWRKSTCGGTRKRRRRKKSSWKTKRVAHNDVDDDLSRVLYQTRRCVEVVSSSAKTTVIGLL